MRAIDFVCQCQEGVDVEVVLIYQPKELDVIAVVNKYYLPYAYR
jgi:hypothetical protein